MQGPKEKPNLKSKEKNTDTINMVADSRES